MLAVKIRGHHQAAQPQPSELHQLIIQNSVPVRLAAKTEQLQLLLCAVNIRVSEVLQVAQPQLSELHHLFTEVRTDHSELGPCQIATMTTGTSAAGMPIP